MLPQVVANDYLEEYAKNKTKQNKNIFSTISYIPPFCLFTLQFYKCNSDSLLMKREPTQFWEMGSIDFS